MQQQRNKAYDIWLGTGLRVEAASPEDAMEKAAAWLTAAIENALAAADGAAAGEDDLSVSVRRAPFNLIDAAVLASQLLALEEKRGDAAVRVARLRAEVDAAHERELAPV
jgi:hypothetical protein